MSKPDPLNWTLLFKKHKTTVLLMLPPSETIANAKVALLNALQSRGLKDINGDLVPEDPSDIELGIPVDKNDLEKGWTKLELDLPDFDEDGAAKRAGKKPAGSLTLQAADVRNGKPIAFRFRRHRDVMENQADIDLELEDANWDVVLPSLDDEDEEPN